MGNVMRDFRDAKAMATSLRQALEGQSVTLTHSQSLELIAKAFGLANWNILAAKIEAEKPAATSPAPAEPAGKTALYCSFCGKSQHDVLTLIAGPAVFICEECVGLCDGIIADNVLKRTLAKAKAEWPDASALEAATEALHDLPASQLEATLKSNADWLEHIEWGLKEIAAHLAGQRPTPWRPDELGVARGWTRDPLAGMSPAKIAAQQRHLAELKVGVGERTRLLEELLRQRRSPAEA
jgi:hypothetical protein